MAIEKTLLLIKPDAFERGLINPILDMVKAHGLFITHGSILTLGRGDQPPGKLRLYGFSPEYSQIKALIAHLRSRNLDAYVRNLDFYLTGKIAVAVVRGDDAVARLRTLAGATNPPDAAEGTIRRTFSTDSIDKCTAEGRGLHNCVHTSDSVEAAEKEIAIFLPNIIAASDA